MGTWRRHLPITSIALAAIFDRIAAGETEFSRPERVLFVAAEFWAAAAAGELATHLDPDALDPLRNAHSAFAAVGAEQVVHVLNEAVVDLIGANTVDAWRQRVAKLEERLLCIEEPVDSLIARYASDYRDETCRIAKPPRVAGESLEHRLQRA